MTDDQQTAHGIDLKTPEGFAVHVAETSQLEQFGLGTRSTYVGTCAHSLAKIDSHEFSGETLARETREYAIPFGDWTEVLETRVSARSTDRYHGGS